MKRIHIVTAACLAGLILAGGVSGLRRRLRRPDPLLSYLNDTFLPQLLEQTGARAGGRSGQNLSGRTGPAGAKRSRDRRPAGAAGEIRRPARPPPAPFWSLWPDRCSSPPAPQWTPPPALSSPGPADLTSSHRYIVSEQGTAVFTVSSDTAVLSTEGSADLTPSSAPDYNQMAASLNTLGLFKGSGLSIGSGYELEEAPTRIQGLIMFLRLIGEEQAALSSTASHPFRDVPDWCDRYVAYAFDKGYTNGVDLPAGLFGPDDGMTAPQYVTLLLRALGYSDSLDIPDFNWATSVAFAQNDGAVHRRRIRPADDRRLLPGTGRLYLLLCAGLPLKGQSVTPAGSAGLLRRHYPGCRPGSLSQVSTPACDPRPSPTKHPAPLSPLCIL